MKKPALCVLLCGALLAGCAAGQSDVKTEQMPAEYGAAIELAQMEFEAAFAEFTHLEADSAAMACPDHEACWIVEFSWRADQGQGVYGLEVQRRDGGCTVLRQGEAVAIDAALGAAPRE